MPSIDPPLRFDPLDPFPLRVAGTYTYAMSKTHAEEADRWLGLRTRDTETEISGLRHSDSHPQERWIGLDPQSFLTPYVEIRTMLDILSPQSGDQIVDLGCGYGRMAHVLGRHFPSVFYVGYEIVAQRVREARRCLERFSYPLIRFETADLVEQKPVASDCYFLYDYGSKKAIQKTLDDLKEISKQRPIKVIARGRASRFFIHESHSWLSEVNPALHFETFSIYQS